MTTIGEQECQGEVGVLLRPLLVIRKEAMFARPPVHGFHVVILIPTLESRVVLHDMIFVRLIVPELPHLRATVIRGLVLQPVRRRALFGLRDFINNIGHRLPVSEMKFGVVLLDALRDISWG